MKTETLPPIPTIDVGLYQDIEAELESNLSRGIYDSSICRIQRERTEELTAQALPTSELAAIEKAQAELDEKRAVLEAKRQEQIQAVNTYRNLVEDVNKANAILTRAEQQMAAEIGNVEDQRTFILQNLGVLYSPFDVVGNFAPLFQAIATIEIMHREWPAMHQKLKDNVTEAHNRALAHARQWGIGQATPKAQEVMNPDDFKPKTYKWKSGKSRN